MSNWSFNGVNPYGSHTKSHLSPDSLIIHPDWTKSNTWTQGPVFGLPFAFRAVFILYGTDWTRCRKCSCEMSVHFDMMPSHSCGRFVQGTSAVLVSWTTIIPEVLCWIQIWWLSRPLEYLLSCSRDEFEIIWVLWHIALFSWNYSFRRWVQLAVKGLDIMARNSTPVKSSTGTNGPKMWPMCPPLPLRLHHYQSESLLQVRMDPCLHVYTRFFDPIV